MPLRLITDVLPVEELLLIVRSPVTAPVDAGLNCTFNVAVWPGFNVIGNAAPGVVKLEPVSVAPLMVTGAVPVDVNVISCVAAVPTSTEPNATLVAFVLSVDVPGGLSSIAKLLEEPPALAVSVTVCVVATEITSAIATVMIAFAGIVAAAGIVIAALLLVRVTFVPPLGAAVVNVIQQA